MCDQYRLRLACAYAQSDQSLVSVNIMLLTENQLEFLSLRRGFTGVSEYIHVKCHIVGNRMSRLICFFILCILHLLWIGMLTHCLNLSMQFYEVHALRRIKLYMYYIY